MDLLMPNPALPEAPDNTQALGIAQSDVLVRTALKAAIADLRAQPQLLDFVFASLPQDTLTANEYGKSERQRAKDWFLNTEIKVATAPRLDEAMFPLLAIDLLDSTESVPEARIGDVHAPSSEAFGDPVLRIGPFVPSSYNPTTGIMVLPVVPEAYLMPGQFVVDHKGRSFEVLEVTAEDTLVLAPNTMGDFNPCTIVSGSPGWVAGLESSSFRESYRVTCYVSGEVAHCIWLHSIVVFILLRYKEVLLEARGLERTTFQSGALQRDPRFESENVFLRSIDVSGYVRHYWPKIIAPIIDGFIPDLRVGAVNLEYTPGSQGNDDYDDGNV
jgi:hypothetical protein